MSVCVCVLVCVCVCLCACVCVPTCSEVHLVARRAVARAVVGHYGGGVVLPTAQAGEVTRVFKGRALVHMSVSPHGAHGVQLAPAAAGPVHAGHVVSAAHTAL